MTSKDNVKVLLEKLREMSMPTKVKFDDIPDIREDGTLETFDAKKFAEEALTAMKNDIESAGLKLEAKVIGISLRVLMLDPNDKTRTRTAVTEIVKKNPKVNLADILATSDAVDEIDADNLLNEKHKCGGDCEDAPYEPKSKYDGIMYG